MKDHFEACVEAGFITVIGLLFAFLVFTSLSACSTAQVGPSLDVCLVNQKALTLDCADKMGRTYSRPILESDNYVCLAPADFETYANYCKKR